MINSGAGVFTSVRIRTLITLLFALILQSAGAQAAVEHFNKKGGIQWRSWDKSAFEAARKANKLILINVGMEGCAACNRMEQLTYSDPRVIDLINKHFVAIAVDSQARPDIGERYSDWGWPATAFMLPDATQVFAMAGNRLPQNFLPILNDLLAKQKTGTLKPDPNSPYAAPPEPVATDLTRIRDKVRLQIDRQFNENFGGWSEYGLNAEVSGARLQHLYLRAHLYRDKNPALTKSALSVSDTFLRVIDPVWGGAYEANIDESVTDAPARFSKLGAIPEKRISNQSNALWAFAEAYQLTGDSKYRQGAADIDRYLSQWMTSAGGTWYANQKDAAPNMPADWWAQDYWLLSTDAERRKYGIPPIDHAVYTDKNAELILAYLDAWQAFGDDNYRQKAERAARTLIKERLQPEGWMQQLVASEELLADDRVHPHLVERRPYLRTQARFGLALLALYQATADRYWLDTATTLADATLATLYDKKHGGFWGAPLDATAALVAPRKPLEDNGLAARFFYDLYVLTKDERYAAVPEASIRAVANNTIIEREGKATGELALALEMLTAWYVEFTIVTEQPQTPEAQALYQTALAQYHPRKLVHFEAPGRYPDLGPVTVFICNPDRCSIPLTTAEGVVDTAKRY
ncbi:Uncharacterised protein [BD1-7 clade bacterium]|uniref:Spermatogenesis-associated protein 20-like TRX domain-containing protein n=1 Tax=BD1-7 clade bacterium TaxID=2029982 RepID=A0A5S9PB98_9GAMM|nr:Uncharacterised protein [BD1-7 clade bacterium]